MQTGEHGLRRARRLRGTGCNLPIAAPDVMCTNYRPARGSCALLEGTVDLPDRHLRDRPGADLPPACHCSEPEQPPTGGKERKRVEPWPAQQQHRRRQGRHPDRSTTGRNPQYGNPARPDQPRSDRCQTALDCRVPDRAAPPFP